MIYIYSKSADGMGRPKPPRIIVDRSGQREPILETSDLKAALVAAQKAATGTLENERIAIVPGEMIKTIRQHEADGATVVCFPGEIERVIETRIDWGSHGRVR